HEIHGKLPPHDQLLEKGVAIACGRRGILNRKRHGMRTNLPEVKVWRELARPFDFRVVAIGCVSVQPFTNESTQRIDRRISAAVKRLDGTCRAIDMKPVD